MPTISIRGMEMPASPIRKLAPLADAAKQRGIHVFHLNIGQPDLPTPEVAIEAIRNIDRKVLEYSPQCGISQLPREVGGLLCKVQYQSDCRRHHHHFRRLGGGVVLFPGLPQSGGMKSLFPSRPMPIIWRLPSLPEPRYAPLPRPSKRVSRCPR